MNPDPVFKFVPDADFAAKLQINIDMTVAMPCDSKYQKHYSKSPIFVQRLSILKYVSNF